MDDSSQTPSNSLAGQSKNTSFGEKLSPELVRQVAERVYSMVLEELRIEQERRRIKAIRMSGVSRRLH